MKYCTMYNDIMYANKFHHINYTKNENLKNSKLTNDESVIVKISNNKMDYEINFNNGYDDDNSTEEGSPFDPLFKFYRFTGLSFLGRNSLDDNKMTKKWLLILEIILFLMTILLTIYWIIILSVDPERELMGQSTVRRIVLPAFLFIIELISCFCRFIVNFKFDQIYNSELFLFDLVNDKKSVFRKLKKVVKNITVISSIVFSLSFVYGSYNLFITQRINSNYSYISLVIKFILYVFHAFMSKSINFTQKIHFFLNFNYFMTLT